MCDFFILCDVLGRYLLLGLSKLAIDVKTKLFIFFRFRSEILYQLPPFLMTISSI